MARQSPKKKAMERDSMAGRAGNYVAPVDTAGMDPTMKRTLNPNKQKAKRKPGLVNWLKEKMGIKY